MPLDFASYDRRRARPVVTVLLLLALTLAVLDRAQPEGPVDAVGDYVRDLTASASSLWPGSESPASDSPEAQNETLRAQIADLEGRLAGVTEVERDRARLAELLNVPTPEGVPQVAARVTSIGVSNYDATVELGKGSDDGIDVGMPVITGRGLVGRIVETSGDSSRVLLTSDSTSNVGVRIGAEGEIGVATGEGSDNDLRVDLVDLDSAIKEGDVAVTSGLQDSLFPPGIPVGTIRSVEVGPRDMRKTVKLDPLAELGKLDSVSVLLWRR